MLLINSKSNNLLNIADLMDPWGCEIGDSTVVSEFEDDFKPEKSDKLADSAEYLAILGK